MLFAALVLLSAAAPAKGPTLADRLVSDVAAVKEGETVVIFASSPDDRQMVSDLFVAIGKKGGAPIVIWDDPQLQRRWVDEVPAANDKALAAAQAKIVPLPDVAFFVDRRENIMKGVAAERLGAYQKAFMGLEEARMKRGTRSVFVGNGLFPNKVAAKEVGLSEPELKKAFDAGLATDPKVLAANGEAVKAALAPGKELVIKNKAGTDLKLKLSKSPLRVSDGVISADEVKAGGPSVLTWLPAGEAYGVIEAGSAEGKIVAPRVTFEGEDIKDLTVEVKAGKVVSLTAKPSKAFDRMKALYDQAPAGKDAVTVFDVGLNPDLKGKKPLLSFVPAGNLTLGWGGDVWAGGTNGCPYFGFVFLTDATLTVDGTTLVDAGALKVAAAK